MDSTTTWAQGGDAIRFDLGDPAGVDTRNATLQDFDPLSETLTLALDSGIGAGTSITIATGPGGAGAQRLIDGTTITALSKLAPAGLAVAPFVSGQPRMRIIAA